MTSRGSGSSWTARAALAHPAWWAAALLLLVNDHYLKGAGLLVASVTGKLSDFAGLLLAPVVLAALVAPRSQRVFRVAHVAVAAVFTLLKLSPVCAALWCAWGGALGMTWRVVSDPTDLVALPMLLLSLRLFGRRVQVSGLLHAWQRVLATLGAGVGLVGIVATSRPPPRYPVITPKAVLIAVDDELQELDRSTGKSQRRLDCNLDWSDQPRVVGETLYIGRSQVQACDLVRGVVAWERDLGGWNEIAYADAQRVIARSGAEIWALSPRSGATLWHINLPSLRAVAWQGRLTIHGPDGSFKVLSLDDGQPLPQAGELPSFVSDELFGTRSRIWRFPSASGPESARKSADLVFAHQGMACGGNRLTAFTNPEQQALWSIPWCPWAETAAVDDTLLVTQSQFKSKWLVSARVPRTGQLLWHTVVED